MLRSIAELAAYGTFAALLTAASLAPTTGNPASSAATSRSSDQPYASTASSVRGRLLFATKGCTGCHTHASLPSAHMQVGPDLTHLADRAATRVAGLDARAYVRQSIRDPGAYHVPGYTAVMPDLGLSDADIDALIAFLLGSGG
ncbi:MAG: cytochrome c [Chloroflexi bacterium]|nr:MAG: cytochrome c [Chloroflexota bacterium]